MIEWKMEYSEKHNTHIAWKVLTNWGKDDKGNKYVKCNGGEVRKVT